MKRTTRIQELVSELNRTLTLDIAAYDYYAEAYAKISNAYYDIDRALRDISKCHDCSPAQLGRFSQLVSKISEITLLIAKQEMQGCLEDYANNAEALAQQLVRLAAKMRSVGVNPSPRRLAKAGNF